MNAKVLVIGGATRAAVALLQALRADGDVCDLAFRGTRRGTVLAPGGARRFIQIPEADAPGLDGLGARLLDLATGGDYDVVIPMGDWETSLLVNNAERLRGRVAALLPDVEAYRLANDKGAVMAHAAELGIATPQVWDWPDAPDPDRLPSDIRYPVVVKARSGSGVHRGLRYAVDRDQLVRAYIEISSTDARTPTEDFTRPLVMEFIPGFVHDACALAHEGEVVNLLTDVRQVTLPVEGGVAAVSVFTDEPELAAQARMLLESLGWNGPADVECKFDPRDGRYKLLEVNTRWWGNLEPDMEAGMNFPCQARDLALGRRVERDQPYEVGMRHVFVSRATAARIQLARTHGITALRDRRSYGRTSRSLKLRDPRSAVRELDATVRTALHELRSFAPWRHRPEGHGLPPELVNTLDRSGDPGF